MGDFQNSLGKYRKTTSKEWKWFMKRKDEIGCVESHFVCECGHAYQKQFVGGVGRHGIRFVDKSNKQLDFCGECKNNLLDYHESQEGKISINVPIVLPDTNKENERFYCVDADVRCETQCKGCKIFIESEKK